MRAQRNNQVPPPPSIQLPNTAIAKLLWTIPCVVLGLSSLLLAWKTDYLGLTNPLFRISAITYTIVMLIIATIVLTKTSKIRGPFNLPHYTLRWFYPCTVAEVILIISEFIANTHTLKRIILLMLFVIMVIQLIMSFLGVKLDKYKMLQILRSKRRC